MPEIRLLPKARVNSCFDAASGWIYRGISYLYGGPKPPNSGSRDMLLHVFESAPKHLPRPGPMEP